MQQTLPRIPVQKPTKSSFPRETNLKAELDFAVHIDSARQISAGLLYVVATPIGNLEDVTLRALRILRESRLIAAEDTRVTRKLLSHYDIHTPMVSFNQNSRDSRMKELVQTLIDGGSVALVSDAGTPGVSDPGMDLVRAAIAAGICVEAIPGASATIAALVTSGLSTARFAFDGFPPRTPKERNLFFGSISHETRTTILYEAPSRLSSTLKSLVSAVGDRPIAICRELTKKFEEVFRGTAEEALLHFGKTAVRGEIAIVLQGAAPSVPDEPTPIAIIEEKLVDLIERGLSKRSAIETVAAELSIPKKRVYEIANRLK